MDGTGTTTCSWFATIHLEATKLLVDVVREQGQRAHVGKVGAFFFNFIGFLLMAPPPPHLFATALAKTKYKMDFLKGSAFRIHKTTFYPCGLSLSLFNLPSPHVF